MFITQMHFGNRRKAFKEMAQVLFTLLLIRSFSNQAVSVYIKIDQIKKIRIS